MIKTGIIYETLGSVSNMQVVESKNPNEVRLSGVFGVCGVRNDNHRVYEKANYAKCLEALQTKIANNNCLGELEQPNNFNINLDNVSHIIEAIQMNEDGTVTGTVKLLNTPKGQIAKAIVEGGAPLFISSRAAGSVDSKGNVTLHSIATYDLVGTPGFSQAKLTSENKKFECLNESLENPCWMIVESETPEEGDEIKEEPKDELSTSTKKEDENNDNNDNNDNTDEVPEYDVSKFSEVDYAGLKKIMKDDGTHVVYIGRSSCHFCAMFIPVMTEAQEKYGFKTEYFDITRVFNFNNNSRNSNICF